MRIILTNRQKMILKFGIEKGFLTFSDFKAAYSTDESRREAMGRMINANLIKEVSPEKFEVNKQECENILNE